MTEESKNALTIAKMFRLGKATEEELRNALRIAQESNKEHKINELTDEHRMLSSLFRMFNI